VGHGAAGVAFGGLGKGLLGELVLEGMQESDAGDDGGLRGGGATGGELDAAEFVGGGEGGR